MMVHNNVSYSFLREKLIELIMMSVIDQYKKICYVYSCKYCIMFNCDDINSLIKHYFKKHLKDVLFDYAKNSKMKLIYINGKWIKQDVRKYKTKIKKI